MRKRILGPDVAQGSASNAMGGDSQNDELTLYPDDDDGDDYEFADLAADSHAEVHASLCRDFDAICEVCSSASIAKAEGASVVFSLALQNLNAGTYRYSAVADKAEALEPLRIVEGTAAP